MRTKKELKQIGLDLFKGLIFTDRHIKKEDFHIFASVFMPIVFMSKKQTESLKGVGLIFEYLDKAGPRGINGYPSFFSLRTLTKKETKVMFEYYEKFKKSAEDIK